MNGRRGDEEPGRAVLVRRRPVKWRDPPGTPYHQVRSGVAVSRQRYKKIGFFTCMKALWSPITDVHKYPDATPVSSLARFAYGKEWKATWGETVAAQLRKDELKGTGRYRHNWLRIP